jgi:hypothetical protein
MEILVGCNIGYCSKDIGKIYRRYERSERLYMHKMFLMEKVMLAFEYEPLVLSQELETLNEEEKK